MSLRVSSSVGKVITIKLKCDTCDEYCEDGKLYIHSSFPRDWLCHVCAEHHWDKKQVMHVGTIELKR